MGRGYGSSIRSQFSHLWGLTHDPGAEPASSGARIADPFARYPHAIASSYAPLVQLTLTVASLIAILDVRVARDLIERAKHEIDLGHFGAVHQLLAQAKQVQIAPAFLGDSRRVALGHGPGAWCVHDERAAAGETERLYSGRAYCSGRWPRSP